MKFPDNFLGLDEDEAKSYEESKVVILPVPYDGTRTWIIGERWKRMDASKGPDAIITASRNMELYDEEVDAEISDVGIYTSNELEIKDSSEKVVEDVFLKVKKLINDSKFPVMIGGEHSISFGAIKALKEKYGNLSVLQLDAHTDLRDSYEGTKFSHASVMARARELCEVVQVGIRSQELDEKDVNKENIFYAKDIYDNEQWMDEAISKLSDDVYITFDLDAFDISIMPSTGTPEPGGLQWYQALKFLKKVFKERNVVGFDVVELAPIDNLIAPDFLAAKLVYKMIGYGFFVEK